MVNANPIQERRTRDVKRYGSPKFFYIFGALAAGAREAVEIASAFPSSRKYAPLMELVIKNGSTEAIDFYLNGVRVSRMPSGTIETWSNTAIWTVELINNDASTAVGGTITMNVYTPGLTADQAVREAI